MSNLAISNIAWSKEYDDLVFKKMLELGYSGLEIAPRKVFECYPKFPETEMIVNWRKTLDLYKITPVSMQSLLYGTEGLTLFENELTRKKTVLFLEKVIEFSSKIGVKNLVFGSPKARCIRTTEDVDIAKEVFFQLAEKALDRDCTISLEANPKEYGTNFLNTTKEVFSFVDEINHSGLKVNLDTGTIIMNNESLKNIGDYIPYIGHVHISEPYLQTIAIHRKEFHKELYTLLKANNYSRFISIEMKPVEQIDDLISSLEYIKSVFSK